MSSQRFGFADTSVGATQAIEDAVAAERAGFDAVWVPDHFTDVDGDRLEPWTVLASVAVQTKRIELGSGVTDTQRSHPSRTAHSVASLDVISGGRAILGIGAGEAMNIIPFGLPWEEPSGRAARLEEAVGVIKLLWTSKRDAKVNFSGNFYNLRDAYLSQEPVRKPHPPVYIGAMNSRRTLDVTGKLGDGWIGWFNTPESFRKKWKIIQDAASAAGRNPDKIESVSHLMVALPRNSEERDLAMLGAKSSLLMEKENLKGMGYTNFSGFTQYQNLVISKEHMDNVFEVAAEIPDEYVHKSMAIGTMEDVGAKVEEMYGAGLKHIVVIDLLAPGTTKKTIEEFAKLIRKFR